MILSAKVYPDLKIKTMTAARRMLYVMISATFAAFCAEGKRATSLQKRVNKQVLCIESSASSKHLSTVIIKRAKDFRNNEKSRSLFVSCLDGKKLRFLVKSKKRTSSLFAHHFPTLTFRCKPSKTFPLFCSFSS